MLATTIPDRPAVPAPSATLARDANQRQVPVVQIAHGRHEADGAARRQRRAQFCNRPDDAHADTR